MTIAVECDICGKQYKLNDSLAGKKVNCKACGSAMTVPGGDDDDVLDLDDRPARRKGGSGKRGRSKKTSGSGAMIGLLVGGGIAVLLLGGVVLFVGAKLMSGGNPPAGAPSPNPPPPTGTPVVVGQVPTVPPVSPASIPNTTATPPATSSNVPAQSASSTNASNNGFNSSAAANGEIIIAQAPIGWTAQPDPPAEPLPTEWADSFDIPINARRIEATSVLYPVVPSPFVLVGDNSDKKSQRDLWNLATGKKVGVLNGVDFYSSREIALSPSGQYVAWSETFGINVYDLKNKRALGQLAVDPKTFNYATLAIVPGDRMVALSSVHDKMRVWQLPKGDQLYEIDLDKQFAYPEKTAYSPGGKYLAVESEFLKGWVRLYEVETGKSVGELQVQQAKDAGYVQFFHLAFSHDGTQLAGVWDASGSKSVTQITIWNMADGKLAETIVATPGVKEKYNPDSQSYGLQWFPDGKRFLVHGIAVIDRQKRQTVYSFDKNEVASRTIRRPLSSNLLAGFEGTREKGTLKSLTISEEEIARATSLAAVGGLPEDLKLPPLSATDYTAASRPRAAASWSASPDPAPALPTDLHTAPLPLTSGAGNVRDIVLTGGNTPKAFVRVAEGENLKDAKLSFADTRFRSGRNGVETIVLPRPIVAEKNRVAVFDLVTKKAESSIEIPFSADLVGVAENAVLMKPHNAKGRIDLYDGTGKHVVGFRPYKGVADEDDLELRTAALLDATHVVTSNLGRQLVGWQLPGCEPSYTIDDVNVFAVSPGKRDIACATSQGVEIRDGRTGQGRGTVVIQGAVVALAFHPNGEQLAILISEKGGNYLYIADLKTGNLGAEIPSPIAGTTLRWSGDNHLLVGTDRHRPTSTNPYMLGLFDLDAKTVAWTYKLPAGVIAENSLDGRLWYGAPKSERVPALQLVAAALPEAKVTQALSSNKLAPELLVQPGGQVALTMNIPSVPWQSDLSQKVQEKMKAAVERTGVSISTGGEIRVEVAAKTTVGTPFQVSKIGDRTNVTSVQENNFEMTVKYHRGQEILWLKDFRTSNNLGFGIKHLKPGDSIQQAFDTDLTQKITSYCDSLVLPSYVFTRRSAVGLGTSTLNGDGPLTGAVSKPNEPVAMREAGPLSR